MRPRLRAGVLLGRTTLADVSVDRGQRAPPRRRADPLSTRPVRSGAGRVLPVGGPPSTVRLGADHARMPADVAANARGAALEVRQGRGSRDRGPAATHPRLPPGNQPPEEAAAAAEGQLEGRLTEARAALRRVLVGRQLTPSPDDDARIDACTDLTILERWLDRAITATRVSTCSDSTPRERCQRPQDQQRLGHDPPRQLHPRAARPRTAHRVRDRTLVCRPAGDQLGALRLVGAPTAPGISSPRAPRRSLRARSCATPSSDRVLPAAATPTRRTTQLARQLLHRQPVLAQPAQQPRVLARGPLVSDQGAMVFQRLDLPGRPHRRDRRVAMQPAPRLDPQVTVDQHESIGRRGSPPPAPSARSRTPTDQPPLLAAVGHF
jgi:hypothetical protein